MLWPLCRDAKQAFKPPAPMSGTPRRKPMGTKKSLALMAGRPHAITSVALRTRPTGFLKLSAYLENRDNDFYLADLSWGEQCARNAWHVVNFQLNNSPLLFSLNPIHPGGVRQGHNQEVTGEMTSADIHATSVLMPLLFPNSRRTPGGAGHPRASFSGK